MHPHRTIRTLPRSSTASRRLRAERAPWARLQRAAASRWSGGRRGKSSCWVAPTAFGPITSGCDCSPKCYGQELIKCGFLGFVYIYLHYILLLPKPVLESRFATTCQPRWVMDSVLFVLVFFCALYVVSSCWVCIVSFSFQRQIAQQSTGNRQFFFQTNYFWWPAWQTHVLNR